MTQPEATWKVQELWVPQVRPTDLPPPMTTSERLLTDRLIRAEIRAARAEEALRWVYPDLSRLAHRELIDGLLG
jgi:hypothetical protein